MQRIILLVAAGIMSSSCSSFTGTLWEDFDPNDRVFISSNDITQAELERRGVKYEVFHDKWVNGYLVEKSSMHRFRDYAFRALGTPVTVTLDTAAVVTIVGLITAMAAVQAGAAPR